MDSAARRFVIQPYPTRLASLLTKKPYGPSMAAIAWCGPVIRRVSPSMSSAFPLKPWSAATSTVCVSTFSGRCSRYRQPRRAEKVRSVIGVLDSSQAMQLHQIGGTRPSDGLPGHEYYQLTFLQIAAFDQHFVHLVEHFVRAGNVEHQQRLDPIVDGKL